MRSIYKIKYKDKIIDKYNKINYYLDNGGGSEVAGVSGGELFNFS